VEVHVNEPRSGRGVQTRAASPGTTVRLLLSCVAGGLLAGSTAAGEARLASIPLAWMGRAPTVEVRIGADGPFTFLVDTCVAGSALSRSVAERLGLPVTGPGRLGDPDDPAGIGGETVRVGSLGLGDLVLHDVDLVRIDVATYAGEEPPPDGVLGFGLLDRYVWTLDFAESRLEVARGSLPPADGGRILEYSLDRGAPSVVVHLAGREMRARVDSRQFGGVALPVRLRADLPLASEAGTIGRMGTARGETFDLIGARLAGGLRIGDQTVDRPRLLFSDAYDAAALGPGALEEFAVTFDPANRRARFERKESLRHRALNREAAAVTALEGGGDLRTAFNRDRDKVRMLLILSPT
jgi:hypothetical protein